MHYPKFANWVVLKKLNEEEFLAKNHITDEEYIIDSCTIRYAKKLDGKTNPFRIDERLSKKDVLSMLDDLEEKGLIRYGRIIDKSLSSLWVTVWIPKITASFRILACIINKLLLFLWLPMICYSLYHFKIYHLNFEEGLLISGTIAGILIGTFLHESGHIVACLAYGGRVFEMGVMMERFMPGAYVLIDVESIKERMNRIQVYAAGIEMNIIIASVNLIFASNLEWGCDFLFGIAVTNIYMALLNLLLIEDFDGSAIVSEFLGTSDIVKNAKKITKQKKLRRRMLGKGPLGIAVVAVCYLIRMFQILLYLLIALNVISIVGWFAW